MIILNKVSIAHLSQQEKRNYRIFRARLKKDHAAIIGTIQISERGKRRSIAAFSESGKLVLDWDLSAH